MNVQFTPDIRQCSDEVVLQTCELQLPAEEDQRLSELLQRQQAKPLSVSEKAVLRRLMQAYQEGLVCKAEALREAVLRGLREPLQP